MKKYLLIFITVLFTTLLSVGILNAAINISSNFNLSAGLPLDNRTATTTTTARDNIPSVQRYDGLTVYVTATDKTYQLQNGITNSDWVEWVLTDSGVGTSTNPFMATYFVATSTTATSTIPLLSVQTALNFFGTFANSLDDLCVAITGGSGLCDGTDATGNNGIATSTPLADTEIVYGTSVSTVGSESAFTYNNITDKLTVVNASTTDLSVSGTTRIATSITGVLQAISGAVTATSTISQSFIDSTIARDSELHSAVTLSGALDYITLSGQDIIRGAIDLATDVTGTLGITNGGTGTSTPATLGDVLAWNGTVWQGRATSTLGISSGGSQTPWTSNINGGGFALTNAGAITGTLLNATSTTGTSTIASGLTIDTLGFVYDYVMDAIGVGQLPVTGVKAVFKSSAINTNSIRGVAAANTNILWGLGESNSGIGLLTLNAANSTRINLNAGTNSYFNTGFNYGFGSTTPGTMLSIGTTTNGINIDPFATSTFGTGINLRSGCFSILNVCINHNAVTLAGTPDYITITGQVITRALINLTTHVTGILPIANGGTGASAFGANRLPYMNSGNTALTSTSTIVVTSDKNLGLGSTTPINAIAIKRTNEDSAISFQVDSTAGGAGGAVETATTSPGTAASGTGGSCNTSCAWANITNILTSNDVYATNAANLFRDDITDYALATNYGFAIPTGATINGIVVGVEADEELADDFSDSSIRLIIGGVISGTDKSAFAAYVATDTFHTFGGPADLWGLTPTVAQVNASDFGAAAKFNCDELSDCATGNMRLDTIQVKIYYTTTGGVTSDQTWTTGVDSGDNKFKISFGSVLGSLTDYLTIASSTGQVSIPTINATSTTASSTFANGINLTAGCFSIAGVCIGGGSGSQTPWTSVINGGGFALTNVGAITGTTINATSTSATSTLQNTSVNNLSIGSLTGFLKATAGYVTTALINLASDVTGTLAVANGGTGITSFGTGIATWLGVPSSANFFDALTGETGSGAVVGGTSPTISGLTGTGAYNLSEATVKMHIYPAFSYATSTAWSASTTLDLGPAYTAELWSGVKCFTDTGTLNVSFTDGTNRMNMFNASTTVGQITLATNNTFIASEKRYVEIGTPATAPTRISCSVDKIVNN